MKKNVYYYTIYGRKSKLKNQLLDMLLLLSAFPKLVLDVFLRKNMGERYFSPAAAFITGAALLAIPIVYAPARLASAATGEEGLVPYYMFFVAYVIMSVVRHIQIRRQPSVYDFERFSMSMGIPWKIFFRLSFKKGKPASLRTVQLYYEPLFCCLVGLLLLVMGAVVLGALIIFCAACYYFNIFVATYEGDQFVLDKIDEMICNRELSDMFINDEDISPSQLPCFVKRPSKEEQRRELANVAFGEEEVDEAV